MVCASKHKLWLPSLAQACKRVKAVGCEEPARSIPAAVCRHKKLLEVIDPISLALAILIGSLRMPGMTVRLGDCLRKGAHWAQKHHPHAKLGITALGVWTVGSANESKVYLWDYRIPDKRHTHSPVRDLMLQVMSQIIVVIEPLVYLFLVLRRLRCSILVVYFFYRSSVVGRKLRAVRRSLGVEVPLVLLYS